MANNKKVIANNKNSTCRVCGKASRQVICGACSNRIQGEALEHKRKEEKTAA